MQKKNLLHLIEPWLIPLFILIVWEVANKTGLLANTILPAPSDVLIAGYQQAVSGVLWEHLQISTTRALIGFVIGGSIAFLIGILNGIVPIAQRLLDTTIQMLRNIPNLALIPLIIIWFGVGEEGKIFLVAISVFFPIYVNTYHGIRNVDPRLIEMGKIYNLSKYKLFFKVIILGAMPSILVGIRYSLGIMWLTLIVAETVAASSGIGYMSMNAREYMQLDIVVLAIILYAILGKIADSIAKFLEKKLLKWNPAYH